VTKFSNYSTYLSGAFKQSWENEIRTIYGANHQRTLPAFKRALIATWIRHYGQPDLRKAGLKLVKALKWKEKNKKYDHTPVQFTQRVETLYELLKQLDNTPGITPMPTAHQRKEYLVESFPRSYQIYFELRGNDYTQSMAEIGQLMEDKFDRDNETESDESSGSSSDDASSSSDESDSDSSCSSSDDEKKRKRKKSKQKKRSSKKSKKHSKKSKKKSKKKTAATRARTNAGKPHGPPKATDTCPIHGGHKWGDCRYNPRSDNYDPPKAYRPNYQPQYRNQGNSQGRNDNQNQGQGQRTQNVLKYL